MVTHDNPGAENSIPDGRPGLVSRYLFTTGHKIIGLTYLFLALLAVFLGMILSVLLRLNSSWPQGAIPFLAAIGAAPERYAALRLLHGSLMVFFVLTAAPQMGFGNYFLPLQIGAEEMAFPTLNLFSLWLTILSLFGMTASFFLPLNSGITLWLIAAAVFCLAALATALNFAVTTIDLRAKGMTLPRLPITVWAWFLNAILSLLIFSILLAGCAAILSDRLLGSQFFSAASFLAPQSSALNQAILPVLWQRLFWYFAQAEVYVAMLPCFGIVTHVIATFSRKPVWKERLVVLALCGIGLAGFCVWGFHMFSTGLNPFAPLVFAVLASSLGVPATILLISWLATLWNARVQLNTAMLFALGFVSLFIAGGLSGLFLARRDLSRAAVSEDFIVGHFHLVMGVAATFAILSALFFWFPKLFHRRLDERFGKAHFWLTFAGVYCIFMPMHWLGLLQQAPVSPDAPVRSALLATFLSLNNLVVIATLWTIAAQILFLWNFAATLFSARHAAPENPWQAATLEWHSTSPVVYRGAYEFPSENSDGFVPQNLSPDFLIQKVRP